MAKKYKKGTALRDLILGGQDGLVNVLGIVLGLTAAGANPPIIIAASLAATFAEAVSMGAVAYTSTIAQRDNYKSELKKEYQEIEEKPGEERQEIYDIFKRHGFKGKLLDEAVEVITQDKHVWAEIMMNHELNLQPVETDTLMHTAATVFVSTIIGSLIPVSPFFFFADNIALPLCLLMSAAVLFTVGVYKAKTMVGNWWKSGLEMLAIGIGAAIVGYLIGKLFHVA